MIQLESLFAQICPFTIQDLDHPHELQMLLWYTVRGASTPSAITPGHTEEQLEGLVRPVAAAAGAAAVAGAAQQWLHAAQLPQPAPTASLAGCMLVFLQRDPALVGRLLCLGWVCWLVVVRCRCWGGFHNPLRSHFSKD